MPFSENEFTLPSSPELDNIDTAESEMEHVDVTIEFTVEFVCTGVDIE